MAITPKEAYEPTASDLTQADSFEQAIDVFLRKNTPEDGKFTIVDLPRNQKALQLLRERYQSAGWVIYERTSTAHQDHGRIIWTMTAPTPHPME